MGEGAHGLTGLGGGLEKAVPLRAVVVDADAEPANAPCLQGFHVLLDGLLHLVDDAYCAEHAGEALEGVDGVAVVEFVVACLHDDDLPDPGRSRVTQVHLRRKVWRVEVLGGLPSGEGVTGYVGSPEVNMGVDPGHRFLLSAVK